MAKKILIADDEAVIRGLIKDSLEGEGYELFEAENGELALEIAKRIKPDLAILDIMMPKVTGYKVCAELKDNPATKHVYVIFVTGRDSPTMPTAVSVARGDEVLNKPFDPIDLKHRIKNALKA